MSEFLGSRISLISKSDIRYVGTLHEINSEESTVSLENVRSFGTEGRKGKPDEEIPASDQVYEYIVFRGSDVKDLRIEDHPSIKENKPPVPDDPAIVGARGRAPPGPGPNQTNQPPPGPGQFPPGQPPNNFYGGAPPPGQGQWGRGGPGPMAGPPHGPPQFGNMPYPPPPGWYPPGQGFPQGGPGGPGQWQNQPQFPQGGPRNGPPPQAPGNNKAQPGAGHAANEPKQQAQNARQPVEAPTPPVESKPSAEAVKAAAKGAQDAGKPAPVDNRVKPVMPLPAGRAAPNSVQDATNAARAAVAVAMAQLGNPTANPMDNLTNKVNEMRVNAGRGGHSGRGRGRGGRPPVSKVEVPDSDFDFAQSNAKFNKDDIVKEADGQAGATAEEAEAPEQAADAPPPAYSKASSFFDNISSEAKDRAETGGQRPGGREWRGEEQRKNMETFGQGSVDGGYRNYRGRGRGGRGRGYNRGGRGGGRPQYQTTEL